ncbi:flagellar assembly protein FliW [Paenibacillus sp. 1011MAR3C5]|uniref:flagellar assembly protein FliW n=1 Tax=Paenibacillus sp. 1011MAR3C5 TaxID=1675787 RepID=UPI000E6D035B|nr:flagellar assembly protein FliW [Paenibacillus sp. 1011MAR3C5]RJE85633.1 flagellar assembly protein FliW [Paenibacillus sp. 1011MAR3C5]
MELQTTRFGVINYSEDDLYYFENGIPGFKDEKSYLLITVEESPFMYLQSTTTEAMSFIVASPFDFFRQYEFTLSANIQEELKLADETDVKIVNIVNVRDELSSATINLGAPIVLNTRERLAMQYILADGQYAIHQPLFGELVMKKGGQ